jgi:serine/threonine protein kinase
VINKIGEGTYGIVYKVRDVVTKREYAMKLIKMDKDY